ncbi:hypothetical protein L7F22_047930 [Adiantum nelumboides]|nr:hypothetical protein [Adiantum nelumboides]
MHSGPSDSYRGGYVLETVDLGGQPSVADSLGSRWRVVLAFTAEIRRGDKQVLFADSIMKVNGDGQMKRRIILVTEAALYTLDHRWCNLKRRVSLTAIDRLYLSELNDNFLAIIVPSEYDFFLASTRKNELVTVLVNTPRSSKLTSIQVSFANRFEYRVDSKTSRIVHFEEAEGNPTKVLHQACTF